MNTFSFTGNLGGDAEQKFSAKGASLVNFSVAVNAGFGEKASTYWSRCTILGKQGEAVLPYLKKGQTVSVTGELNIREYSDRDGNKKTSNDVWVDRIKLVGGKQQTQDQSPASTVNQLTDDVPF